MGSNSKNSSKDGKSDLAWIRVLWWVMVHLKTLSKVRNASKTLQLWWFGRGSLILQSGDASNLGKFLNNKILLIMWALVHGKNSYTPSVSLDILLRCLEKSPCRHCSVWLRLNRWDSKLGNCRTGLTGLENWAITPNFRGLFSSFLACWKYNWSILNSMLWFGSERFLVGLETTSKLGCSQMDGLENLRFVKFISSWSE